MNANILNSFKRKSTPKNQFCLFNFFFEHIELIAALFSGLLILVTWLFKNNLSTPLWVTFHLIAFAIGGYAKAKEGITETIHHRELNVEMLMIFAAIGSASIGYWTEGAILIFIFSLAGALETYTLNRSNKEISSLMKLQPEEALLITNETEKIVPVANLTIGDTILVRASERIPADGKIIRGTTAIDESAITGESMPVSKKINEEVLAGTVALDGTISVAITKPAHETLFQKIIEMVQSAQEEKSPSQLFIEKFEGTYVKVILTIVAIMMFLPYFLFNWSLTESVYRAMVLLVVASPCALVASIMPATLAAISNSARNGILLKGGVHAENLGHLKAIAFDKTGTITNGKPFVTDFFIAPHQDEQKLLSIIGAIENESTHPLAHAITSYSRDKTGQKLNDVIIQEMKTISGKGVSAIVADQKWEIGNAAFVGKDISATFNHGISQKLVQEGKTIVFAKHNEKIVALFALKDTIRKNTKKTIKALKKRGIFTVMLTGDHELTAKTIAEEIGIDHYVAECLPEEKVHHVKWLREKYEHAAMIGDGINDAPALASANVGIAVGEGTDVALETADVVLMKNDLSKIAHAITLSNRMNRIVKQNISFSLFIIAILIIGNYFQYIDLPLGVIGHEGSTILVILNGLRLLK